MAGVASLLLAPAVASDLTGASIPAVLGRWERVVVLVEPVAWMLTGACFLVAGRPGGGLDHRGHHQDRRPLRLGPAVRAYRLLPETAAQVVGAGLPLQAGIVSTPTVLADGREIARTAEALRAATRI
ncbi:MAG: hypothetical protein L0H64_22110 [Pseudonocardia sp.]|nr:hypothetical protein [Pseudonocardia sp.]